MRSINISIISTMFLLFSLSFSVTAKTSSAVYYMDTTIPEGVWIDATAGKRLDTSDADDGGETIPIGFDFSFNGIPYSEVFVSANGFLKFTGNGRYCEQNNCSDHENQPIPNGNEPNGIIAPYWDDLVPYVNSVSAQSEAGIYSHLEGSAPNRSLTVAWIDTALSPDPHQVNNSVTFQTTLYEGSNMIVFRYEEGNFSTDSATIGIEYQGGSGGIQYSHNGANNGQRVRVESFQSIRFLVEELDTDRVDFNMGTEYPSEWIDATIGRRLEIVSGSHNGGESTPIGFDFSFYGIPYSDIFVNANGFLQFNKNNDFNCDIVSLCRIDDTNESIPDPNFPNSMVAPYWDNLQPFTSPAGGVYKLLEGTAPFRRLTISWIEIPFSLNEEEAHINVTFEVTLYESSNMIVFQYGDNYLAENATIGVEDQVGSKGTQYLFNGSNDGAPVKVDSSKAIRFFADSTWAPYTVIEATPASGEAPLAVKVNPQASHAFNGGSIVDFSWDFGDGTIINGRNASHTYTHAGNYVITLTAIDNDGVPNKARVTITVTEPSGPGPKPTPEPTPEPGPNPGSSNPQSVASDNNDSSSSSGGGSIGWLSLLMLGFLVRRSKQVASNT